MRLRLLRIVVFPTLVLGSLAACGRVGGAGDWRELRAPDGAVYAVPPGWVAAVGQEAETALRRYVSDLPPYQQPLLMLPRPVFFARSGQDVIAVSIDDARMDGDRMDSEFVEATLKLYRQILENFAHEVAVGGGQLEVKDLQWGSRPGTLGSVEATLRLYSGKLEQSVRYMALYQTDRIATVVAFGNAPVEDFLQRSAFLPKPPQPDGGSKR